MVADLNVAASDSSEAVLHAGPLLPVDDPFYDEPDGLAAMRPGAIIRTRQVVLRDFWASRHLSLIHI